MPLVEITTRFILHRVISVEIRGISENSEDTDFGNFRWRVTTVVEATAEPTMRRIEVTVAKYSGAQSEPFAVHTLAAFLGET